MLFLFSSNVFALELSGLVIDETLSAQGRNFYNGFSHIWRDVSLNIDGNVLIKEDYIPRSGTKLNVSFNGFPLYVTYLGRRQVDIKALSQQAVLISIEGITQYQAITQDTIDLSGDGY